MNKMINFFRVKLSATIMQVDSIISACWLFAMSIIAVCIPERLRKDIIIVA